MIQRFDRGGSFQRSSPRAAVEPRRRATIFSRAGVACPPPSVHPTAAARRSATPQARKQRPPVQSRSTASAKLRFVRFNLRLYTIQGCRTVNFRAPMTDVWNGCESVLARSRSRPAPFPSSGKDRARGVSNVGCSTRLTTRRRAHPPTSKDMLKKIDQPDERNKNAADPIPLAELNDDMGHAGGPMPAVRFQADNLTVSNGPPSVPFGNFLFHRSLKLSLTTPMILRPHGRA